MDGQSRRMMACGGYGYRPNVLGNYHEPVRATLHPSIIMTIQMRDR